MEYRVYGQDVVVRMDRGEEILDCIRQVCEKEHILLGSVSGIGAIGEVTLGVFNREKFIYENGIIPAIWRSLPAAAISPP